MPVIQRVVKATTRRGKRILLKKEPQVNEGPKRMLFCFGRKSSEVLRDLTKDLYNIKKPDAKVLTRKNDLTIFEDATPMEHLCRKNEAALFALSSHTKKRPNNLVLGRIYNGSILDMLELHVEDYTRMKDFLIPKLMVGTKPVLIFNGPTWEEDEELIALKSILIDIFYREEVKQVRLPGLEHSLNFTATPDKKILIRSYKVILKKSGGPIPRVEMVEMGPRMDLAVRRSKLPTDDLMKEALRRPKELRVGHPRNISTDDLGNVHGRIHLGRQEINQIQTRKMAGLKKYATIRPVDESSAPSDDGMMTVKIFDEASCSSREPSVKVTVHPYNGATSSSPPISPAKRSFAQNNLEIKKDQQRKRLRTR